MDNAAVWYDSLDPATTLDFMKYKHGNDLFNYKQEDKSVYDYCAHLQRLAGEMSDNDEMWQFAVINGLRADIKNHVTMNQPKT